MIKIVASPKNKKTLFRVSASKTMFREGIHSGLKHAGAKNSADTRRNIRRGTKTGRVYIRRGRRHRASAPGQSPANDTGRLLRSVKHLVKGADSMEFGYSTDAQYGKYLEEGTERIQKRPNIVKVARRGQRDFQGIVDKKVNTRLKK